MKTLLKPGIVAHVTTQNPLLVEFKRKSRRFLLGVDARWVMVGWTCIVAAIFISSASAIMSWQIPVAALNIVSIKFALMAVLLPVFLHGTVCGEREKRTWDALLCAPLTTSQLVVGKYVGALAVLAIGYALFAPLEVVGLMVAKADFTSLVTYLRYNFHVLTFLLFESSLIFFFSSRAKRSFAALATCIGAMFFYGTICAFTLGGESGSGTNAFFLTFSTINPIAAAGFFYQYLSNPGEHGSSLFMFLPELGNLIYLSLTVVMLVYSEKTILFPDTEVPFLPKKRDAGS